MLRLYVRPELYILWYVGFEPLYREKPTEFSFLLTPNFGKDGTPGEGPANQDCWKTVSPWSYPTFGPRIVEEEEYGMALFLILEWF